MKNQSPALGPGWEGSLASRILALVHSGPQPWETLQLGQEGACEGLVVAAELEGYQGWW